MTAILQMWPGAKVDPKDPAGVWSAAVNDLSSEQIRYAIQQMARTPKEYPLNPAQFRAIAMAYRAPSPRRHAEVQDESAKSRAWRSTQQQFAAKLNGPGYELPGIQTDFPVSVVIEDVTIDHVRRKQCIAAGFHATHDFDSGLFARLKHAFELRWAEFVAGAWHVDDRRPGNQSAGAR